MKLFKCKLTSDLKEVPNKTEYLRASSINVLSLMYDQCFKIKGSGYGAYDHYKITRMLISHFPEVRTMRIK